MNGGEGQQSEAARAFAALLAAVDSRNQPGQASSSSTSSDPTLPSASAYDVQHGWNGVTDKTPTSKQQGRMGMTNQSHGPLMSSLPIEHQRRNDRQQSESVTSDISSSYQLNYTPQPTRSGRVPQPINPDEADHFTMLFHDFLNCQSSDDEGDPDFQIDQTVAFDPNLGLVRRSPRKKSNKRKRRSEDDEDDEEDDEDEEEEEELETDFSILDDPYPELTAFMSDHPSVSSLSSAVPTPDTFTVPTPNSNFAPSPADIGQQASTSVLSTLQAAPRSYHVSQAAPSSDATVSPPPVKRKRGRPRKHPLPPSSAASTPMPQPQPQLIPAQQYRPPAHAEPQQQHYSPAMPPPPVPSTSSLAYRQTPQQQHQPPQMYQPLQHMQPEAAYHEPRQIRKETQKEASANYRRTQREKAEADARRLIELERENAALKERVLSLESRLDEALSGSAAPSIPPSSLPPAAASRRGYDSYSGSASANKRQRVDDNRAARETGSNSLGRLLESLDEAQIDSISKLLEIVSSDRRA